MGIMEGRAGPQPSWLPGPALGRDCRPAGGWAHFLWCLAVQPGGPWDSNTPWWPVLGPGVAGCIVRGILVPIPRWLAAGFGDS